MDQGNRQDDRTDIILDSIADGVFTVDQQWRISSFNRAAERITGISREEAIGQRCCDVFRASICETGCALRETMASGLPIVNRPVYIIDADGRRVPISVSTALLKDAGGQVVGGVETFRDLSQLAELQRELEQRFSFHDIISKNPEMLRLFDLLPGIAESDATILIEGDSGTGKELVARAIHDLSGRREKSLVTINCGALPDTLLESELFGHKAGAFTDARKDRVGRFAQAEGGTVFLDEIGDISPALQVRLLRVLQDRTFEPLGGTETVTADVRVLAATNKNLRRQVKAGKFREDLFYRINVVNLKLPPLRERRGDIPLLIDHFITRFNRLQNKLIADVSPDVLAVLMNHDFPGNIRELEHIIEHAFVLTRGSMIETSALPDYLRPKDTAEPAVTTGSLDELEAQFIREMLRRHNGNRTKTAGALGIHKTTLWRKMKRLGIKGD